jgi:hypothetical protein
MDFTHSLHDRGTRAARNFTVIEAEMSHEGDILPLLMN